MTLKYLIGKQYREQKKTHGGDRKSSYQNDNLKKSVELMAEKTGVGSATVSRAALFSENFEKICKNAGIKRQEILLGNIDATMKDVNDLAAFKEPEFHKRAIERVISKEVKKRRMALISRMLFVPNIIPQPCYSCFNKKAKPPFIFWVFPKWIGKKWLKISKRQ